MATKPAVAKKKAITGRTFNYSCGVLILSVWSICYLQLSVESQIMLGLSMSSSMDTSTHSEDAGYPLVKVIRASELLPGRLPRELKNQQELLSVHSCPGSLSSQQQPQQQTTVTLVTQSSPERFWLVRKTCQERWTQDPMAVATYFESTSEYEQHGDRLRQQLAGCPHVSLIYYIQDENDGLKSTPYPINLLRNLALEVVQTSHVLVHDVDFVPSRGLANDIRAASEIRQRARLPTGRSQEALVVPALQLTENVTARDAIIPSKFTEVVACVQAGNCSAFIENENRAHAITRTDLWLQRDWYVNRKCHDSQNTVSDLRYIACIDEPAYEPYLVLPWCPIADLNDTASTAQRLVPYYDERFVGYGWNKIQWIQHLRNAGFLFWVLPAGFLIHVPHELSAAQREFIESRQAPVRNMMQQVYQRFRGELQQILPWRVSNLRTCRHWGKYYANLTSNEAFCKAYA